jgi:hypothetical protein
MWAARTPDELTTWKRAAEKDARLSALVFGGGVWIGISILLAGGWVASAQGMASQKFLPDSFWSRLLILAIVGFPFAIWMFRREKRKHLERALAMTICPGCDTAGEYNEGSSCNCGGAFVLQSTVRWIEDEEPKS